MSPSNTSDREITISRTINAPRELVWKAFTEPEHLIQWWGPNGFSNTFLEIDIREGGVWTFIMHGPDGVDYPNRIVFEKIVEPELLEYTHSEKEDDPNAFKASITLEEQGGSTVVTLHTLFDTKEERDRVVEEVGAIEGGKQTLGRLDDYVSRM